jgi:hypothetical protein
MITVSVADKIRGKREAEITQWATVCKVKRDLDDKKDKKR